MTDLRAQLQSTFGDAYTIERELGGGGMSRVFVATEQSLGRPVVVKVLPSETAGALSVERFRREIRLAASLQQANIVPVLSAGDAAGVAYYTMPFVKGESLRSHLAAKGALPIPECMAILRDVARALAFAHAEGVVHRDIKPENILLSGGTAVVTDFGIAKAVAASSTQPDVATLTQLGVTLGTPAYMAPEQAVGQEVDQRADIYALGVVAYEMLTGATPFAGRSAQAMLAAHAMEAPPPLADKRADAPPGLVALVTQCLAKEQSDRPESASTVLTALDTVTTPVASTPASGLTLPKPTIAVLPLSNMSLSADDEYFSDGVSEDIIAQLSRIAELQVIARTSVMRYRKTEKRAREIGTDLGATHIIEGSLRRAGQKLRIVAKLIDAHTESTLWTDTFDRELADVFAIQTEVAERVADALKLKLALPASGPLRPRRVTTSLDAYDAYLRGRFERNKGTSDCYRRSIEHCERAIAIDPTFAEAHVVLAIASQMLVLFAADPASGVERARTHAMRAIQLDPMSSEAHATLAYINFWFDWNWIEAERLFSRAMELGPNSATTHNHLAVFLANMGRADEAVEAARRSIELDPLWSTAHHDLGWSLFQAGKYAESIISCNRALELAPDYALTLLVKGGSLMELGEFPEAITTYEHCLKSSPDVFMARVGLVLANARAGGTAAARHLLEQLRERRESPTPPSALAWGHAALGETVAALDQVERMIAARDPMTITLAAFVWWDPLRRDSRFDEVLRRLRFPDWSRAVSNARRLAYVERQLTAKAAPAKPIVAVLPLTNISSNADDEYFADGMTEDIIAQLSKVASLKVTSRTSVMRYKKTDLSMGDIAKALGASHVVEGTVRRAGSRLRIVAQLIEAASDAHLWAQTFDRELTDVFAVQAEVAEQIAGALRAVLVPAERARIARKPTRDQEAYNLFLLARHHANLVTADGLARATDLYQRAVERDPAFARAWGARAQIQTFNVWGYYGVAPRAATANVIEWASRALELDPDVAEAHSALGVVAGMIDLDFAEDGRRQARALSLSPNLASVHLLYANHLAITGRYGESLEHAAQALELDPASEYVHIHANWLRYCMRHFDDALAGVEAAESQFGRKVIPLTRGEILIALGRADETIESFRELYERIPISWNLGHLAWVLAAAARESEARQALARLHECEQREYVWPVATALTYAHLGEMDVAFRYLRQCVDDRAAWIQWPYAPTFDVFRDDPRFDALNREIGATAPPGWRWPLSK